MSTYPRQDHRLFHDTEPLQLRRRLLARKDMSLSSVCVDNLASRPPYLQSEAVPDPIPTHSAAKSGALPRKVEVSCVQLGAGQCVDPYLGIRALSQCHAGELWGEKDEGPLARTFAWIRHEAQIRLGATRDVLYACALRIPARR